ncbi:MAG: PAS domain S-box protein, partial [Nitrospirota bacterium]|nr:PAS domain S-box protein [Nitrospirota bacterium]
TLGWVILLKVGTNGVLNALIADLALILLAQRFRLVSRPLGGLHMNQVLASTLLSATLLPATFLTFVQTRTTLRGIESQFIGSLKAEAGKGALMMENILQRRLEILRGIAHRAAEKGLSSSDLMENMVLAQEVFPECSAFFALDQKGKVQACLSSHFDCSKWKQTMPLEDNKLTGVAQHTGMPMLADDFQPGLPGLNSAPAMVVPILQNGEPLGVIVGILDLDFLRTALFRATSPSIEVRLVNARDKPILGSTTFFNETLGHGRYSMRRMEDGILHAIPADSASPSATFVGRWQQSFYLYSLPVGQTPWTLEARVFLGSSFNRLMYALLPGLATFWGLALLMLLLAWVAAKALSRPLGQLEALASRVKDEPLTPIARTDWPATPILEVNSLSVSLHMLLATLRDSLQALKGANETLEREVAKRTAELRETIDRLKSEIEQRKRLEDLLERAQRIARIGSWERDLKTNGMVYSKETYKIFGLQEGEDPSYKRFMSVVHPEDRALVNRVIEEAVQNHACLDFEYRIVRKNGEMRYIREQAEVVLDEQGKPVKFTGTNQDVTEKKRAELALAESEALLRTLLEAMPLAVGMKDAECRWLLANPQTLRLFQLEGKKYVGKTDDELSEAIPELAETLAYCKVTDERTWKAGTLCRYEEKLEVKDGQDIICEVTKVPLLNPDCSRKGLIFVGRDITEERLAQRRIEQMTYYDELTGLPNRMLLAERLQQVISHHPIVVVALIDLDRFKVLNESLGFEASNEIIRSVAERLRLAIRALDTVSRPWGDEFSIVMP